jgi:hypothetical protein
MQRLATQRAFGLAAAKLISIGHSVAVLWLALALLVLRWRLRATYSGC